MSLSLPITSQKVRNHFHYSFWKYLLLIVIALFGWNLLYTTTRYQSPENLKVEFYAEGNMTYSEALQALADQIHTEVLPDMEEVTATITTFDEMYGDMQLMVWVSAGQGDVYLLSKDRFQSMAENEAALDLQPYVDSGALQTEGIDLTGGYVRDSETGLTKLMGIPADSMTGLNDYGLVTQDAVFWVLAQNGNDDNTIAFLNYLLTHMQAQTTAQ